MVLEDIFGRWNSLSITAEESKVVRVDDAILDKGELELQYGLLGKVLSKKPFRKTSFKLAIDRMWKVVGGFTKREMENDVFLFLLGMRRRGGEFLRWNHGYLINFWWC